MPDSEWQKRVEFLQQHVPNGLECTITTREDAAILLGIVMLLDGKVKEAYDQLHPLINANNKADTMQKLDTLCRQKLLQRNTLTLFTDALVLHIQ